MVQIEAWIEELKSKLIQVFGERLVYIGLQGSYRRNEADSHSDIDVMAVLDCLNVKDLPVYRGIIATMPEAENACGFLCGKGELAHWPRHEIFLLLKETRDIYGSLAPFVPSYTKEDVQRYAQINTANLYHEICHRYLYENCANNIQSLSASYKSVFYILQCVHYLRTGEFYLTKQELLHHLSGIDRDVLETALALRARPDLDYDFDAAYSRLFHWCQKQLS